MQQSGRPSIAALVLASYVIAILGVPLPRSLSAAPTGPSPCQSSACCCPTEDQCRQQCCCASAGEPAPEEVPTDSGAERRVIWRSTIESRACSGLASYWLGLLCTAVLPSPVSWTCEWIPLGWLWIGSSHLDSLDHPPTAPPPRA